MNRWIRFLIKCSRLYDHEKLREKILNSKTKDPYLDVNLFFSKDEQKEIDELEEGLDKKSEKIANLKKQINLLEDRLEKADDVPEPELVKQISGSRVKEILKEKGLESYQQYLLDQYYYTPMKESVEKFLKSSQVDKIKYRSVVWDCDDFAIKLWGEFQKGEWARTTASLCCGSGHAFNLIICDNEDVYIIEPQTDEVKPVEEAGDMYKSLWLVVM